MTVTSSVDWNQFGAAVAATGSFGLAAFGIVESAGKAFAFTWWSSKQDDRRLKHWGLPYVGLGAVRHMILPLRPALRCAYGDEFAEIIAQQYRSDRSQGSAPDTIRQGVRLGLPFLGEEAAENLIASVWHMDRTHAAALARALQASEQPAPSLPKGAVDPAQALAGRFATALDARISAGFQLADERYETVAKTAAGVVAILLALVFNYTLGAGYPLHGLYPWPMAALVGIVAVPLGPVAKDLSSSLQNALTAFKSIGSKP